MVVELRKQYCREIFYNSFKRAGMPPHHLHAAPPPAGQEVAKKDFKIEFWLLLNNFTP